MHFRAMQFLPLLIAIAACSDPDSPPPEAAMSVDDAFATVTRENIEAHLKFLAADERRGRFTGSPEYLESAQYVADQFASLGLEPAGTDGWFQPVQFMVNQIDIERSGVTMHQEDGDAVLKWKENYIMGGDKVRAQTEVTGEVVFAGYGVHAPEIGYSDYDGIDVEGKIVAMFFGAPSSFPHNERAYYSSGRTKNEELVKRGAIGAIGLRDRVGMKRFSWERMTLNAGVIPGMGWMDDVGDVADHHHEIRGSALFNELTATELFASSLISFEEALDAADRNEPSSTPLGIEVTLQRETGHHEISSPNVVGLLRGSDPELADEYIVYTAHLDHLGVATPVDGDDIYNGFYDNAMGSALLIEMARAMAAMPEAPRRSILFVAVTGEERGLLGSDYFAQNPPVDIDSIVANVNLDMPLLLFPIADVVAFGAAHSSLIEPARAAVEAEGFTLSPDPAPEEVRFIRSDQYSFVRQGVPALFVVPGSQSTDPDIDGGAIVRDHRQNHYHKPTDDFTRPLDWDSAIRFARANVRLGLNIASADERPTWNEGDFFGDKFGR